MTRSIEETDPDYVPEWAAPKGLLPAAPVWVSADIEVDASQIVRLRGAKGTTVMISQGGLELTVRRPAAEVRETLEEARFDAWLETGDDRLQETIE